MRNIILIFIFTITALEANNNTIEKLAKTLNLIPGSKATSQWERVFSSERRIKKHRLDNLSPEKLTQLKVYLIEHAADSDQPIVPGL